MEENKNIPIQNDPLKVVGREDNGGLASRLKKYLQAGDTASVNQGPMSPASPVSTQSGSVAERLRASIRGQQVDPATGQVQPIQGQVSSIGDVVDNLKQAVPSAFESVLTTFKVFPTFVERSLKDLGLDTAAKAFSFMAANPKDKYDMLKSGNFSMEAEVAESFQSILEKNMKQKEVEGFDSAFESGDLKRIVMMGLGNAANFVPSLAVGAATGLATGGNPIAGFAGFSTMFGGYEMASAVQAIAEEDGRSIEQILADRDEKILVPAIIGAGAGVLETLGFKLFGKMFTGFMGKDVVKKAIVSIPQNVLFQSMANTFETTASVYNETYARTGSHSEAAAMAQTFLDEEGLDVAKSTAAGTLTMAGLSGGAAMTTRMAKNFVSSKRGTTEAQDKAVEAEKKPIRDQVQGKIENVKNEVDKNVGPIADEVLSAEVDQVISQFSGEKANQVAEKSVPEATKKEIKESVKQEEDAVKPEQPIQPVEGQPTQEQGRTEAVAEDPVVQQKILQVKDKASLKDAIAYFATGKDKKAPLSKVEAAKVNFQATVIDWIASNRSRKEGISKQDWYKSRLAGVTRGEITAENFDSIKSSLNQDLNDIVFHGGKKVDFTKFNKFGGVLHVGNMGTARGFNSGESSLLQVFEAKKGKGIQIEDFGNDFHTSQMIASTEKDSGTRFIDWAKRKGLSAEAASDIAMQETVSDENFDEVYNTFKDKGVNKFKAQPLAQFVASEYARENGVDYFYYNNIAEPGVTPSSSTNRLDGEVTRQTLTTKDTAGMPIDRNNVSFAVVNPSILTGIGDVASKDFSDQKAFLEKIGTDTTKILYQNQEGKAAPRAQVAFLEDGRAIISAVSSPDITSFIHEFSHVLRRDLSVAENEALEKAFGLPVNGEWTVAAEEKFARAFERYVADGQLPSDIKGQYKDQVRSAFEKLAEWFRAIHESIKGQYNVEALSPEVRSVMDAIVQGKDIVTDAKSDAKSATDSDVQRDRGAEGKGKQAGKPAGKQTEKSKVKEDAVQKQKASEVSVQPEAGASKKVEEGKSKTEPKAAPATKKEVKDEPTAKKTTDEGSKQVSEAAKQEPAKEEVKQGKEKKEPAAKIKKKTFSSIGLSKEDVSMIKEMIGEDEVIAPHSQGVVSITSIEDGVRYYDVYSDEFYDNVEDIPDPSVQKKVDKMDEIASLQEPSKENINSFIVAAKQLTSDKLNVNQRTQAFEAISSMAERIVKKLSLSNNKNQHKSFFANSEKLYSVIHADDTFLTDSEVSQIQRIIDKGRDNIQEFVSAEEKAEARAIERAEKKAAEGDVDISNRSKAKGDAKRALKKATEYTDALADKIVGLKSKIQLIEKNLSTHRSVSPDGRSGLRFGHKEGVYKDLKAYKAAQAEIQKLNDALANARGKVKETLNILSKAKYEYIKQSSIYSKAVLKNDAAAELNKIKIRDKEYKQWTKDYYKRSIIRSESQDLVSRIQAAKLKPVASFSEEAATTKKKSVRVTDDYTAEQVATVASNAANQAIRMLDSAMDKYDKIVNLESREQTDTQEYIDLKNAFETQIASINERAAVARANFQSLKSYRKGTIVPDEINIDKNSIKSYLEDAKKQLKKSNPGSTNILDQPAVNVNNPSQRSAFIDSIRSVVENKFSTVKDFKRLMANINTQLKSAGIKPLTKSEVLDILKNTSAGTIAQIEAKVRAGGKDSPTKEIMGVLDNLRGTPQQRVAAMAELDAILNKQAQGTPLSLEELYKVRTLPLVAINQATRQQQLSAIKTADEAVKFNNKVVNNKRAEATNREIRVADELFVESILGAKPDENGVYQTEVGRRTFRFTLHDSSQFYAEGDIVYHNGNIYQAKSGIDAGTIFNSDNFERVGSVNLSMTRAEYLESKGRLRLWTKIRESISEVGLELDGLYSFLDKLSIADKDNPGMTSKLVKYAKTEINRARINYLNNNEADIEKIIKGIGNALGVNNVKEVYDKIGSMRVENVNITFEDESGSPVTITKSKAELLNDYVRMKDPNAAATYEAMKKNKANDVSTDRGWSDNKAAAISAAIDGEMKAIADFIVSDGLGDIFSRMNNAYRKVYGEELVREENYFPWKRYVDSNSEASSYFLLDKDSSADSIIRAVTNKNIIERTNSTAAFKSSDFFEDLFAYVNNANYYSNFLGPMRVIDKTLNSSHNTEYINTIFGKKYVDIGRKLFANLAANRAVGFNSLGALNTLRTGLVVGSLGANLTLIPKQLSSMPAYANAMPMGHWLANMATLPARIANGKASETWRMMSQTSFFKARYRSSIAANPDLIEQSLGSIDMAISKYKSKGRLGREVLTHKVVSILMSPIKYGDMGATMIGGEPIFRAEYDKVLKETGSKEKALEAAEIAWADATSQTQQSDAIEDRSVLQTRGSAYSLMTTFMSTPILYGRLVNSAIRDVIHGRGSKPKAIARVALFTYVLPALFYSVSAGSLGYVFGDDEDERFSEHAGKRNLSVAFMGLIQHIPILYPLMQGLVDRAVFGNKFRVDPVPTFGRLSKAVERIGDIGFKLRENDQVSDEDLLKLLKETSQLLGVNVNSLSNLSENWKDVFIDGSDEDVTTQFFLSLGYSKEALGLREYGEKGKPEKISIGRRKADRRRSRRRKVR